MAFKGQQRIIAHHAAAVVDNADQLASAAFHLDANSRRACIQRVLQQLLYHRRRPFHHLARGDLVRDLIGKNMYPPHPSIVPAPPASPRVLCVRSIASFAFFFRPPRPCHLQLPPHRMACNPGLTKVLQRLAPRPASVVVSSKKDSTEHDTIRTHSRRDRKPSQPPPATPPSSRTPSNPPKTQRLRSRPHCRKCPTPA